jgi:hypothetical protein
MPGEQRTLLSVMRGSATCSSCCHQGTPCGTVHGHEFWARSWWVQHVETELVGLLLEYLQPELRSGMRRLDGFPEIAAMEIDPRRRS